jgi:hypothetical protein
MQHELEMAMKRITLLMESKYLPRLLIDDLQTIMNAAMAWRMMVEKWEAEKNRACHDQSNGSGAD